MVRLSPSKIKQLGDNHSHYCRNTSQRGAFIRGARQGADAQLRVMVEDLQLDISVLEHAPVTGKEYEQELAIAKFLRGKVKVYGTELEEEEDGSQG